METKHYFIKNLQEFSWDTKAVEKLKKYLQDIEAIFPTIEDVYGQAWNNNKIYIELNNSTGAAKYISDVSPHFVEMGIYNRNIKKEYPKNLWGCLFHETHHAFMHPVIYHMGANKDFNGGYTKEPFNRAFMAMTYLRLSEKGKITKQLCDKFFDTLVSGIKSDGGKNLFKDYVSLFSKSTSNFSKFISYLKSSNAAFTDRNNFSQDLDKVKKFLCN